MSALTPPTHSIDLETGKHSRTVQPLDSLEELDQASKTLCRAFADSSANDYLLRKFFKLSLDEPMSRCRLNAMLTYLIAWYHDLGGEVVQAKDFDAVGVWSSPGRHLPHTYSDDPKFNEIFFERLDERKLEVLPAGMDYYYLFMIGKDPTQRNVRGSVRKILEDYKKRADEDNCACILEAINEHAKSVYEYFGYKVVQEFKFGEGEINEDGTLDPNGKGFTAYLMIYYKAPELLKIN
ncbi:hypothetical protein ZYGR_0Z00550 [Zygosaccharomyces rouxii]|uniref:ZYRO0G01452p n=2 Tax=Zygosaccharomyces rouxii TaxID=4956 RepID=C5E1U1_ZYGRC|nr:uncharacterized protein ZYRO0G01452g [Zygosaccharomyces rouxii]KAH9202132.1 hypothetical protein LQ764DRAFT_227908 [Zygosaccharomyces rouxii]GAV50632.1 hypothetical protein ZYGR_0Z00550 [Zygosaccharomyces rouxii]CAR29134.1 ZYRO0G01452p [Zygosaccharomyces rouxii]